MRKTKIIIKELMKVLICQLKQTNYINKKKNKININIFKKIEYKYNK
jgi:hypothetical protein